MVQTYPVLIVDDSVIYRKSLSDIITQIAECTTIHTAPNAEIALKKIEATQYALVFSDINMPGMNGFELQKKIKVNNPKIQVILMSSENYSQASLTIEALNNGAVDFIQKPTDGSHDSNKKDLEKQVHTLFKTLHPSITFKNERHVAPVKPTIISPTTRPTFSKPTTSIPARSAYALLAIGVSTGGPQALGKIIPLLPPNIKVPIVIVQHMPANFTKSLAESLDKKSELLVTEAAHGDILKPGTVYIAPGGKQMAIQKDGLSSKIIISDAPPENSCKPAVDYTFRSISKSYLNEPILSMILTGMGSDGCGGISLLKSNKAYCITQSAKSCVVYGMPKAVDDAGLSDISIDIDQIAPKLRELLT
ncbi:MAG: chemotaxis-specific protein-glutamate methyltransferase CheB [Fibrobacterales bacterium]